jgi:hypothetical protein
MHELSFPATQADLENVAVPPHVLLPKGMLEVLEQKLLYLLARDHYDGVGEIVDFGAFSGASSYALAAGVMDNCKVTNKDGRVCSYDSFRADEPHILKYIQSVFFSRIAAAGEPLYPTHKINKGDSFVDVFHFQTQRFNNVISCNIGSLAESHWRRAPLSLLYLDGINTSSLQSHVFKEFVTFQIPGESILIQRNFYHPWHPHIHVVMEYLSDYFEIVVPAAAGTRAYRLVKSIPRRMMRRAIAFDFSDDERVALLEQMLVKSPERPMLNLILARQLHLLDRRDRAAELLGSLLDRFGGTPMESNVLGEFKAVCPSVADRFPQPVAAE